MITYFIQCGEFVKIGKTNNLRSRLATITTANPLPVNVLKLAALPEIAAHRIANGLTDRQQGEWFKSNQALIEWIDSIEPVEHSPQSTGEEWAVITFRLPQHLRERIKSKAAEMGMSESGFIRFHIGKVVDATEEEIDAEEGDES